MNSKPKVYVLALLLTATASPAFADDTNLSSLLGEACRAAVMGDTRRPSGPPLAELLARIDGMAAKSDGEVDPAEIAVLRSMQQPSTSVVAKPSTGASKGNPTVRTRDDVKRDFDAVIARLQERDGQEQAATVAPKPKKRVRSAAKQEPQPTDPCLDKDRNFAEAQCLGERWMLQNHLGEGWRF